MSSRIPDSYVCFAFISPSIEQGLVQLCESRKLFRDRRDLFIISRATKALSDAESREASGLFDALLNGARQT